MKPPAKPQPSLTADALATHLARMQEKVTHTPLPDLLAEQALHCVDGRNPSCVISAPGGNAGVFLLMLAALEASMKRPLSASGVDRLFHAYLDRFGHFYMHTDRLALEALEATLAAHPGISALCCPYDAIEDLIFRPTIGQRESLLRLLIQPEHVGCGHLRLMMLHGEAYGVRPELPEYFFAAFFNALWRGDRRVIYDVLASDHRERAVVNVTSAGTFEEGTLPRHCPLYEDLQVFLNFPQASAYLLRRHEVFFKEQGVLTEPAAETFASIQTRLAERQLRATLRHLAPNLPVFNVIFDDAGFTVEPATATNEEAPISKPIFGTP
ncbi:hypothetical protein [Rhodocaloribacter sp.]